MRSVFTHQYKGHHTQVGLNSNPSSKEGVHLSHRGTQNPKIDRSTEQRRQRPGRAILKKTSHVHPTPSGITSEITVIQGIASRAASADAKHARES